MFTDKFARTVTDERVAGKSQEEDAKGLVSRSVREGTPLADMQLRESGDARSELIGLARQEFARLAGITLVEGTQSEEGEAPVEGVEDVIPEQKEALDEQLKTLVADAIDARYANGVEVKGKKRTGEEIVRAIPDVAAFLAEVDLQKKDGISLDFFEINEEGQLVMKDDCAEAYGLGENPLQARIRQTRVVYTDADGQNKVMTGEQYFTVTKRDSQGRPLEMKVSDDALAIDTESLLMERGLPTLHVADGKHVGEYVRMNTGQLEVAKITWTDDKNLSKSEDPRQPDFSRARFACWSHDYRRVDSSVRYSRVQDGYLGSRGVLRVNLNLES